MCILLYTHVSFFECLVCIFQNLCVYASPCACTCLCVNVCMDGYTYMFEDGYIQIQYIQNYSHTRRHTHIHTANVCVCVCVRESPEELFIGPVEA